MATQKNIGGLPITFSKISVEQCLESLAQMQEQMRKILPYVPDQLSSQITLPALGMKRSLCSSHHRRRQAERSYDDRSIPSTKNQTTESDDSDFENDPILVNSQLFLENFKSGAIKRELNRSKNKVTNVPPPSKPIKFLPITRKPLKIPNLQLIEEPNLLKEQHPKNKNSPKPMNQFRTKEEAERFMMFIIKEIIQLFSQIANAFKLDAVKGMNYPPTDSSQKAYVVECCMQTMRELQVLVNGPVKKLRNELTGNFITILPQFKRLDDSNYITSCSFMNTECVSSDGYQRERAPGDGS